MKPPLMLNMIVRNESARIERCLASVLPHVKAATIFDTGSTDDTVERIYDLCAVAGVEVTVQLGIFKDFSQARNRAFDLAKRANGVSVPWCQFALLVDADMELVVEDPKAFDNLDAGALAYDMMQTGGAVSYGNRRLISLNAKDNPYIGVTHEYLDLPAAGLISGARFVDHADGFNRTDKYKRDAALLNAALIVEPANGRYLYYLGNTYRDGNNPHLAIDAYEKRVALGGWDEETHSAMMNLAGAKKDAGDLPGFVSGMVDAFSFRPRRAEPLYDLAKYYREKGDNAAALLFAKQGVNIKRPDDLLFVNDYVYSHGLRYEYSISGFYDPAERQRAFEVTDDLALDPTCPAEIRASARSNLFWHTKPLKDYCPSFAGEKLDFTPPAGYIAMNPSVEVCNSHITCNVRTVNYKIDEHGRYMIGPKECGDAPIVTRNFLLTLSPALDVEHAREIIWDRPPPAWDMVMGLEDIRLFRFCGTLHFSATVRELSAGGVCQMVSGTLASNAIDDTMRVNTWKVISDETTYEKNWMPMPSRVASAPRWMYRLDTTIEPGVETIKMRSPVYAGEISGSSQLIPFKMGFLAVVHEASSDPSSGKRTYWHRFVWFDKNGELHRISFPFVFYDRQIEFCAGLAAHPNNRDLLISFGVRDAEAHVATVNIEEVARMVMEFE